MQLCKNRPECQPAIHAPPTMCMIIHPHIHSLTLRASLLCMCGHVCDCVAPCDCLARYDNRRSLHHCDVTLPTRVMLECWG